MYTQAQKKKKLKAKTKKILAFPYTLTLFYTYSSLLGTYNEWSHHFHHQLYNTTTDAIAYSLYRDSLALIMYRRFVGTLFVYMEKQKNFNDDW